MMDTKTVKKRAGNPRAAALIYSSKISKIELQMFDKIEDPQERERVFAETLERMKKAIEELNLREAVNTKKIQKLRGDNESIKEKLDFLDTELKSNEKAKELDTNYLLQQEETLARSKFQSIEETQSKKEVVKLESANQKLKASLKKGIDEYLEQTPLITKLLTQLREIAELSEQLKDREYAELIRSQLELYEQRVSLILKERDNVKGMLEEENPELERQIAELRGSLEALKEDRTKDQTTIFELERKLGFLQVHYTYDRAKLMNNHGALGEHALETEIKMKAENILARLHEVLREVPE